MTQRYPLAWPAGKPRTASYHRRSGSFREGDRKGITISGAIKRIQYELDRAGASNAIVSSNVELRLDGQPRMDRGAPGDPGVALYFDLGGKPHALGCDAYSSVPQNLAAVAAHLEATRAIARHGVATTAEMFRAFVALPRPREWWEVLGVAQHCALADLEQAFRRLAAKNHPDQGGTNAAMAELNRARDMGLKDRRG